MIRVALPLFGGLLLLLANAEGAPEVQEEEAIKNEDQPEHLLKDFDSTSTDYTYSTDQYYTTLPGNQPPSTVYTASPQPPATGNTVPPQPPSTVHTVPPLPPLSYSVSPQPPITYTVPSLPPMPTTTDWYGYTDDCIETCHYNEGNVTGTGGRIKISQGGLYRNCQRCVWNIILPNDNFVKLRFKKQFGIEGPTTSCPYDYVEIFDSYTGDSLTGRLCGFSNPPDVTTSRNRATIVFVSDYTIRYWGAFIKWTQKAERKGELSVGSVGGTYSNDMDESWDLYVPTGKTLTFSDWSLFDIEGPSPSCPYDYLEFQDTSGGSLGKYCGNLNPGPLIFYNSVKVIFKSDGSVVEQGFITTYRIS